MHVVNGAIGTTFFVITLLHLGDLPEHWLCVSSFAAGSFLAFFTLKNDISIFSSRILAIATTLAMFFYFAGFFTVAPSLGDGWYKQPEALEALSLLIAAFFMIPVLSDYSCRCKATCREQRKRVGRAFFTVPRSLENQSTPQ